MSADRVYDHSERRGRRPIGRLWDVWATQPVEYPVGDLDELSPGGPVIYPVVCPARS
jgi:hypothetical protein